MRICPALRCVLLLLFCRGGPVNAERPHKAAATLHAKKAAASLAESDRAHAQHHAQHDQAVRHNHHAHQHRQHEAKHVDIAVTSHGGHHSSRDHSGKQRATFSEQHGRHEVKAHRHHAHSPGDPAVADSKAELPKKPQFNCEEDLANAVKAWPAAKAEHCCETEGLGCEAVPKKEANPAEAQAAEAVAAAEGAVETVASEAEGDVDMVEGSVVNTSKAVLGGVEAVGGETVLSAEDGVLAAEQAVEDGLTALGNTTLSGVTKVEELVDSTVIRDLKVAEGEVVQDLSDVTQPRVSVLQGAKKVAEGLPGMEQWLKDLPRHLEVDQHGFCVRQDPYVPVYGCGLKLCKCRQYVEDCAWVGAVTFLQEYESGSAKAAELAGRQLLAGRCQSSETISLLTTFCCFSVLVIPSLLGSSLQAVQQKYNKRHAKK
eukprot:TRINITY_DN8897_c0_g1_i1.p1 TRINITY_DN8897_c0_g1~~TRINITY_DN8897_c0_g1_i1.p1  ORF type:complete len:429 (-),score=115.00 TRINITY_DN8897_c0_g1_i1:217-1503(-)